ncbi:MAG: orotidine-5'-phosphate decarboxylase [Thermovirgaceae bacterium]|nr:orotidine-5'-phosphate decarboxylase [Thermovirgaceae bacterium]
MKDRNTHKIILAADLSSPSEAEDLLDLLREDLVHVKIGPRLFASGGIPFVNRVIRMGFKVFLDLKLHDIPNTVSSAVDYFASQGIWALTIHSAGGAAMLQAARSANRFAGDEMLLFGVTVLTSLAPSSWDEVNPGCSLQEALKNRAAICSACKMDGIVCSPTDLPLLVPDFGGRLKMVVPGIRDNAGGDDQMRTASPEDALKMGADYLVVGRPIIRANSPAKALQEMTERVERVGVKE